jgi:hypothetical protein
MTQKELLFVSRILFLILLAGLSFDLSAQRSRQGPPKEKSFLDTQWWLGIRMGTTLTSPTIGEQSYAFSPIDYDIEDGDKQYESLGNPGLLVGLDIIFYHQGFSVGIQPAYKQLNFGYAQSQTWFNNDQTPALTNRLTVAQELHLLEIPLMLKYDLIQFGKVRPFIQGGVQYSWVMDADRSASLVQQDFISTPPQNYAVDDIRSSNRNAFQSYYGWVGGLGVNLDYLNIRTIMELNYQMGMQPVTATDANEQINQLAGIGDAYDELSLDQLYLSVSFVFPLRYIDNTFNPY